MENNNLNGMKKVFLIFLSVLPLFISCDDDEDLTFVQENYVLGKWFVNQIGFINENNTIVYEDYINETDCEDDNLTLNQDGTYEENDFEFINSVCQNAQVSGSYTLENNKIILNYINNEGQAKQKVLTIITLTYDEINLSFTDIETNELVFLKLKK